MSATATTLLGAVLLASAEEESGGRRGLARRIEISRQSLHEVLAGAREPGRHVAGAIGRYLNISAKQVLAWAHEPAIAEGVRAPLHPVVDGR